MRISDQEYNRLQVLKAVRRAEPIARTQLARLTGFAGGTITEVTRDLLNRGFVVEQRVPPTGRGRPRVELRLNPEAAFVVSAFFNNEVAGEAKAEIVDMRGDQLFEHSASLKNPRTMRELALAFATIINDAIALGPVAPDEIQRIGVTLPGIVDTGTGTVHWMAFYKDTPSPFADIIEERLGIPVVVDTSANVMARAEHWFGTGGQVDDFTLAMAGIGMGSAIYTEGMLRTGSHGIGSELTHMKVVLDSGRMCYCGSTGCLAAHASGHAIVEQICDLRGEVPPSPLVTMKWIRQFAADVEQGDTIAGQVFERAGTYFGVVLANHINSADPARIIVYCNDDVFMNLLEAPMRAAVDQHVLAPLRGRTPIEVRRLANDWQRKGNAALALEQIYQSPAAARRSTTMPAGAIHSATAA